MGKNMKGGIEGVIATIIMVGLVLALIIATIIPMTRETRDIGVSGTTKMSELGSRLGGSSTGG